mgnify:CR=1 FL=1
MLSKLLLGFGVGWLLLVSPAWPMHAQGSGCVPPGVSAAVLIAPIVQEEFYDMTPYGPAFMLDVLWESRVARMLVVGGEMVYFDPDLADEHSKPWYRQDPASCVWMRPGVQEG